MITTPKPVKVKRVYKGNEWRPYFALVKRLEFSLPGAPLAMDGKPERLRCWVFLQWIETKSRDDDNLRPWEYRLKGPE